jgi:hypothetical protein
MTTVLYSAIRRLYYEYFPKNKKNDLNIRTSTSNYFVSVDESLVLYAKQRIEKLYQDKEKSTEEKHEYELMTPR